MIFMGLLGIWVVFMIFLGILWNVWDFYGIFGNFVDFYGEMILWDRSHKINFYGTGPMILAWDRSPGKVFSCSMADISGYLLSTMAQGKI